MQGQILPPSRMRVIVHVKGRTTCIHKVTCVRDHVVNYNYIILTKALMSLKAVILWYREILVFV